MQQVTIRTEDWPTLKPLLEAAIEHEKQMLLSGIRQTCARMEDFEQAYQMTSGEFERRLHRSEIDETADFSDWRMEIGMQRLLEHQYEMLCKARFYEERLEETP